MNSELERKLEAIQWKDLLLQSKGEIVFELFFPMPLFIGAAVLVHFNHVWLAFPVAFVAFLLGLRLVHGAFHYSIGLPKLATEWVMFFMSCLMFIPIHSVKFNHLMHHKHCLNEKDIEGKSARMKWWQALLYGPLFPIELIINAFKNGNVKIKRWIILEMIAQVILLLLAINLSSKLLLGYILLMVIGECFTAFFAVWTVHHDLQGDEIQSRSIRKKWFGRMTFNMFFHFEHHQFPKVPTNHLEKLADRIDEALPELKLKEVI
jgi:fatty acid desaturase